MSKVEGGAVGFIPPQASCKYFFLEASRANLFRLYAYWLPTYLSVGTKVWNIISRNVN